MSLQTRRATHARQAAAGCGTNRVSVPAPTRITHLASTTNARDTELHQSAEGNATVTESCDAGTLHCRGRDCPARSPRSSRRVAALVEPTWLLTNTVPRIEGTREGPFVLAERVGFEPTIGFHLYTRSRRAPSTARPSLLAGPRIISAGDA